jgi:putative nucleotidyltransferase with HDIG domain
MLKKIQSQQIKVGMFIDHMDCAWMNHPFFKTRFQIKDEKTIEKISASGINHVIIDTLKGTDVDAAPTLDEVQRSLQTESERITETRTGLSNKVPRKEEIDNAKAIVTDANKIVCNLMNDVRLGKQVEIQTIEPITERIITSVLRNKDALISLSRIKNKDEYTYLHSVSVSGLMVAFARSVGLDKDTIKQIGTGSLLHDIGKVRIPPEILNKPGKLTEAEFSLMKTHAEHSREILASASGISSQALKIAVEHHERIDGTGYPEGLKDEEISAVGQMSAIVDVYDALTSERCYKEAWEPSFVLKKLLEWSPNHFQTELVHQFIRCLGIYPVGALVQLASGLIGVVTEQGENDLLRPTVRIIYSAKENCYVPVKELDLAKRPRDSIQSSVSPRKYNINLTHFI